LNHENNKASHTGDMNKRNYYPPEFKSKVILVPAISLAAHTAYHCLWQNRSAEIGSVKVPSSTAWFRNEKGTCQHPNQTFIVSVAKNSR